MTIAILVRRLPPEPQPGLSGFFGNVVAPTLAVTLLRPNFSPKRNKPPIPYNHLILPPETGKYAQAVSIL